MKNVKFLFLLPIVAMIFFITSCKDNTTTPTPNTTANYFPMTTGSYWTFDSYESDTTGTIVQNTKSTDSVVIVGTVTKSGQTGYEYKDYSSTDPVSNSYFYKNGQQLYTYANYIQPSDTTFNFFTFGDRWILLADNNAASWKILDTAVANLPITYSNISGKLTATINVTGNKGSMVSIQWGPNRDKTVQAQEFLTKIAITGTITSDAFPIPGNINAIINIHSYFADGIGLVKTKVDPSSIAITVLTQTLLSQKNKGSETFMTNYSIK